VPVLALHRHPVEAVPVEADDVRLRLWIRVPEVGERGPVVPAPGEALDRRPLLRGCSTENVDPATGPVGGPGEVARLDVGVADRVADHEVCGDPLEGFTTLRDDQWLEVRESVLEVPGGRDQFVGLIRVVGVADHAHERPVGLEDLQIALQVGIPEVVVQHEDGEVQIPVLDLQGVVLATPVKKPRR